jgi:hypothetical protein
MEGSDGRELAQNSLDLLVMPSGLREAGYKGPVGVITPHSQVAEELDQPPPLPLESTSDLEETSVSDDALDQAKPAAIQSAELEQIISKLGYTVAKRLDAEVQLAISTYPTAELLEWVREGGKLLYISNGIGPFFWAQNRSGAYSGSWITSFTWLREEAHRRLKVKNPLGLPFKDLMPRSTILGLPYDDPRYQPDYLSGMVSGWVHQPSVHTVQFRYGRGRVVMTTFALESALLADDPAATAMLHDLVEHLGSDACQPALLANY